MQVALLNPHLHEPHPWNGRGRVEVSHVCRHDHLCMKLGGSGKGVGRMSVAEGLQWGWGGVDVGDASRQFDMLDGCLAEYCSGLAFSVKGRGEAARGASPACRALLLDARGLRPSWRGWCTMGPMQGQPTAGPACSSQPFGTGRWQCIAAKKAPSRRPPTPTEPQPPAATRMRALATCARGGKGAGVSSLRPIGAERCVEGGGGGAPLCAG
jgi:hypothetical protein